MRRYTHLLSSRRPQALSVWGVGVAAEQDIHERTVVERRDPLLGQVFDRRFRIEAKIAAGGFGAIYRVTHVRSGHEFALKVLHPNLTSDPRVVARFQREGVALTRLRDPHTITAYELGEAPDGTLYIVMELLRGESLYERFRAQGALPWRPVLALARAVCSSLTEAHGLGIIHRDLKPTNIHLEPGEDGMEYVKVLDFGIAKILQDRDSDIDASDLTHVGQMIGTLDYMSPEQMVGGQCGPSSDIYTLGVVMYEMIAGRKPFDDANSAAAALASVLTVTPARLSTLAIVSPDADRVVMKCLERQHGDRFQTADALADALDEILTGGEEAVTSVAPSHRAAPKTASAIPLVGRPSPPRPIEPAATPVAARPAVTDPNLDSTLVGHEPVARLPATPLRPAGTPHVGLPAVGTPQIESLEPAAPEPPVAAPRAPSAPESPALEIATLEEIHIPSVVIAPDFPDIPAPRSIRRTATTPTGTPAVSAPASATPAAPTTNLREAYPMIHRQPPSPTRPQPAMDDRPASSVVPFDMARAVRRDALVRRLAVVIGLAVAALVALWVASRF
jgi:eukaryotic-like serine/threonine-protein kinase